MIEKWLQHSTEIGLRKIYVDYYFKINVYLNNNEKVYNPRVHKVDAQYALVLDFFVDPSFRFHISAMNLLTANSVLGGL